MEGVKIPNSVRGYTSICDIGDDPWVKPADSIWLRRESASGEGIARVVILGNMDKLVSDDYPDGLEGVRVFDYVNSEGIPGIHTQAPGVWEDRKYGRFIKFNKVAGELSVEGGPVWTQRTHSYALAQKSEHMPVKPVLPER
ncbi:hypothetical protein ACFL1B_06130 [Nanoarchaeota archaeon]